MAMKLHAMRCHNLFWISHYPRSLRRPGSIQVLCIAIRRQPTPTEWFDSEIGCNGRARTHDHHPVGKLIGPSLVCQQRTRTFIDIKLSAASPHGRLDPRRRCRRQRFHIMWYNFAQRRSPYMRDLMVLLLDSSSPASIYSNNNLLVNIVRAHQRTICIDSSPDWWRVAAESVVASPQGRSHCTAPLSPTAGACLVSYDNDMAAPFSDHPLAMIVRQLICIISVQFQSIGYVLRSIRWLMLLNKPFVARKWKHAGPIIPSRGGYVLWCIRSCWVLLFLWIEWGSDVLLLGW